MPSLATADPRTDRGRIRLGLRRAAEAVLARPPLVTLTLIAVVVATFLRLQVGGQLPPLRLLLDGFSGRGLANGRLYTLVSATLLTRDVFMCVSISVSLLVALGTYEVVAGHLRAAVVAVVAAVLGPAGVAAGLGLLQALGLTWAGGPLGTVDIGASAIVAAAAASVAAIVRDRRLTVGLLVFVIGGLALHHQLADWEHLLMFPLGYATGRILGRSRPAGRRSRWPRVAANLLAAAVVIAAAVPVSARLLPDPPAWRPAAGATTPSSAPRLLSTTFPAPALADSRQVLVLLPAGYDSSQSSFPVVVLLHGDPGSPQDFISLLNVPGAAQAAGVAPFIAVMPDGRGPRLSASWYANIAGQQMGTALSTELRAWVSATFRTDGSWSYAGLSSGATGAAYLPLLDPLPVHGVCGLSGFYDAHIPVFAGAGAGQRRRASPLAHPDRAAQITFLGYGLKDPATAAQSKRYAAALRSAGHRVVLRGYPGGHSPAVWIPGFLDCFRTLLPAAGGASPR